MRQNRRMGQKKADGGYYSGRARGGAGFSSLYPVTASAAIERVRRGGKREYAVK